MRRATKIWLITATVFVIFGLILLVGVMAAYNFDFNKLSTVNYETNTYEVSEAFDKISIDVYTTEISFAPSDDEQCRVVYTETDKIKHTTAVQNGTLVIDTVDTRKWYDNIGIFIGNLKMTVYLPQKSYASLSVDTDTGDIVIPHDFSFGNIEITGHTADVKCLASVSDSVKVESDTGSINADNLTAGKIDFTTATGKININSVIADGKVDIQTNTGTAKLTDISCASFTAKSNTGNITLKNIVAVDSFSIESDTGDVNFEECDAAEILIKTDTGDVSGTLLSEKIFTTESDTGSVDVPKTATGGRCEVISDTGDIKIAIAN